MQAPNALPPEISVITGSMEPRRWRVWLLVWAVAILLHLLLLLMEAALPRIKVSPPPPVEIQQVDPAKLEAIRRDWKARNEPKSLLLDKDPAAPGAKEASPDARYFSDKNIQVEKEQRARNTQVMPKAGTPGAPPRPRPREQADRAQQQQEHRATDLGKLGLPLNLKPREARAESESQRLSQRFLGPSLPAGEEGADQALADERLPVGSQNLLNAQESVYYSFYSRLYEAIGPIWQSQVRTIAAQLRLKPGEYSTAVDVVLDREGNLVTVNLLTSSGYRELDQVVDQAWARVKRFPNPPKGLLDERGEVHTGWTFTVSVNSGMGLQYQAPELAY